MTKLAAIVSFILSLCFYAWQIKHGVWSWELFMLTGFALEAISEHPKAP